MGATNNETTKQADDALMLARDKMDDILATHEPEPLTPVQDQAISDILQEAREYYREEGLISDEEWSEYIEMLESSS